MDADPRAWAGRWPGRTQHDNEVRRTPLTMRIQSSTMAGDGETVLAELT